MAEMTDVKLTDLLSSALEDRRIEAAVVCVRGCGTSVITDPGVMKGLDGCIIGSESTEPDASMIGRVGEDDVLDPSKAHVDQVEGLCVVYDNGVHRVAGTTGSVKEAQMMRDMFGSDLYVIGVFEELSNEDSERARELMDIISVNGKLDFITDYGKDLS